MSVNDIVSVTDLNEEDFNDPITLLDAIRRINQQMVSCSESLKDKNLMSITEIQNKYGLSKEYIHSSVLTGEICPAKIDLYFTEEDAKRLAKKSSTGNPLIVAFEKELEKMVMNYSYKPLLLLALLRCDNYCDTLDNIVDFYFNYYNKRIQNGMKPEKSDSGFVTHANDRLFAKRTILRYPASVLAKKAFVIYDKSSDTIALNPLLFKDNIGFSRESVTQRCHELLNNYYFE